MLGLAVGRCRGVGLTPPHPPQGSLEKGRGLVPGKTKSDDVVAAIRVVGEAVRRTHPPRFVVPRTTAKGPPDIVVFSAIIA